LFLDFLFFFLPSRVRLGPVGTCYFCLLLLLTYKFVSNAFVVQVTLLLRILIG